jgi:hypothetical protein
MKLGVVAEFASPEQLVSALEKLREMGLRDLDAYTPYPMVEIEPLLRIRRSFIPWAVLTMGIVGAITAYVVQWWCAAVAYPLNVGGRPYHSAPAFVPITFETTILFAALTAFVTPLLAAGLPRLHRPVFEIEGFESASVDGYWVAIGADDAKLDHASAERELRGIGARRVVHVDAGRSP